MALNPTKLAALVLSLAAATMPALASSTASSSISDSIADSVNSISNSIKRSSDSSSKTVDLAEGDYKIIEMAAAHERPGTMRMTLQAAANPTPENEYYLYVPNEAAQQSGLGKGDVISARKRPYGIEFAVATTHEAFFLAFTDEAYRELGTKAVTL